MGVNDGTVLGVTKILDQGADDTRMNIVLIAEGFKDSEQVKFNDLCDEFVTALQAEPWYPTVGGALNVHRLNVTSTDSGADDPPCPDQSPDEAADGTFAATFFDASFCDNNIHRALAPNWESVRNTLNLKLPGWHVGAVLVNTPKRGGSAHRPYHLFASGLGTHPDETWTDIAMHELGHAAFGLADEYNYGEGDHADPWEPIGSNVTATSSPAALASAKPLWRNLITPEVPVPTMKSLDCTLEDDKQPNVLPSDSKIGLFEGANHYHCGNYRPAYRCRMRESLVPFCGVCIQAIATKLGTFITSTPRMEVVTANGSLLLDFGEVAVGLTLYRSFEVRNIRVGFPGTLRVTLSSPAGKFGYAPGTLGFFTLPAPVNEPFTSREGVVAYTAPASGGPEFFGSLKVTTSDDPLTPSVTVDLHARAVPPKPVDSVLVFDRSGSMSEATGVPGQRKVDLAIAAGKLYASLLRDEDRIGIVRFNDSADDPSDVLLAMEVAGGAGTGKVDADAALTAVNLNPSGTTSIGGGIILGSAVLDGGAAESRGLVVLTDGIQNAGPDIPAGSAVVASKHPAQRVFAVGLGLNQLEDSLVQIASVTNGIAQITGDIVGYKEFLLQKLFVQILTDVSDEAFVKDPLGIVPAGETRATPVFLGEVDITADFVVVFRPTSSYPKAIRAWLEAPDGTIVRPSDDGALTNFEYSSGSSHMLFRWQFPAFPDRPAAHVGRWLVWVENRLRGGETRAASHAVEPFFYSVMCKARSDLRLSGRLTQATYTPGSGMTVTLEPTVYGQPIRLDADPSVSVVRPDGATKTLKLDLEGDVYTGTFAETPLVGPYHLSVEVSAVSPGGNRVTRFRQFTGLIFHPGRGGGGGDGHDCREMAVLLRRVAELAERCCGSSKPSAT